MKLKLMESGLVTTNDWLMSSDGDRYKYLFSAHWKVVTDKAVPIKDFHSRERWSLFAEDADGNILALIPGCQVNGFVQMAKCPEHTPSAPHKADEPDLPCGVFNLDEGTGYK